ncbi:hypothetical protein KEM56_007589 [Ascosphaera pollenicola]|nr:hypothetical protein KEM56_007589 [Ascosphaera pollenicola]
MAPMTEEDLEWFKSTFHPIPRPQLPDDCMQYSLYWISKDTTGTADERAALAEVQKAASELVKTYLKMAGRYLRVVVLGTPGFALFESAKRFVQAQGLFHASMYVLLICAPLNGLLNYLFVWRFGFGYIGAPMAVAITNNLMPLLLFLYVYFIQGMECWNGFTTKAFRNWGPMIQLATPGLLMLESETLAFEILTLSASWLGTTSLAAQSVLATLTSITFQFPFPLSIAGSTRIANLIGAELPVAAKLTSKVMFVAGLAFGTFNLLTLTLGRNYIPYLFTSDNEVARLVAKVLPICASFQVVDSLAAISNGTLRGVGRQSFGGYVQLICYYVVALPISFLAAFPFELGLKGTWGGVAIGLALVSLIEVLYIRKIDWRQSVKDARARSSVA